MWSLSSDVLFGVNIYYHDKPWIYLLSNREYRESRRPIVVGSWSERVVWRVFREGPTVALSASVRSQMTGMIISLKRGKGQVICSYT